MPTLTATQIMQEAWTKATAEHAAAFPKKDQPTTMAASQAWKERSDAYKSERMRHHIVALGGRL